MYTCRVDKTNHTITIMNRVTKRGITMRNVGDEMAAFLVMMAQKAGVSDDLGKVDPTYESYQGNTSCFFCGAFEEGQGGKVAHGEGCLWESAKNLSDMGQETQQEERD